MCLLALIDLRVRLLLSLHNTIPICYHSLYRIQQRIVVAVLAPNDDGTGSFACSLIGCVTSELSIDRSGSERKCCRRVLDNRGNGGRVVSSSGIGVGGIVVGGGGGKVFHGRGGELEGDNKGGSRGSVIGGGVGNRVMSVAGHGFAEAGFTCG